MALNFDRRVAIVTGAGSGMGREHALMLASRNARVVVNDISANKAREVAAEIESAGGTAAPDTNDIVAKSAGSISTSVK